MLTFLSCSLVTSFFHSEKPGYPQPPSLYLEFSVWGQVFQFSLTVSSQNTVFQSWVGQLLPPPSLFSEVMSYSPISVIFDNMHSALIPLNIPVSTMLFVSFKLFRKAPFLCHPVLKVLWVLTNTESGIHYAGVILNSPITLKVSLCTPFCVNHCIKYLIWLFLSSTFFGYFLLTSLNWHY